MSFVIVIGILLISLHVGLRYRRVTTEARQRLAVARLIAAVPVQPDHMDCANHDCEQIICCCRKPAECPGTTTLGCDHGEDLCWDCRRLGCRACAREAYTEQARAWAAGR